MPRDRPIQAVIFDLDGVLVSTDELHYRAWQTIADREGIPFDRRVNHLLRGVGRMESLAIILREARRPYPPAEKARLADEKNALYRAMIESLGPGDLLPGAAATLSRLRIRGVRAALASASRNARRTLERVGLERAFEVVVDGRDITASKPDPQILLIAASRLGLPPESCLVVEDAPAGIEAARRAGMAFLGIGTEESLPGVHPRAADLSGDDLDRILNELV